MQRLKSAPTFCCLFCIQNYTCSHVPVTQRAVVQKDVCAGSSKRNPQHSSHFISKIGSYMKEKSLNYNMLPGLSHSFNCSSKYLKLTIF